MSSSGQHERKMPRIDCPACGERMRYAPWQTKRGGRYLCGCGYKFWVTRVKNHTSVMLPEFLGPKKRSGPTPEVPEDLELRKSVMRQWKEQQRPGLRPEDDADVLGPPLALGQATASESAAPCSRVCLVCEKSRNI